MKQLLSYRIVCSAVLGIEPEALHMLGKHSSTEQYPLK
jgi:hypothetical protein